ncbi:MAG: ATP-dependent 6-phosphofructokinase [bacterium (Candidatus Stahlbacteria) CG08_land_8_20_14_0_20_40_26]|nr:MAG: ATP-dependent 6-phosphofructokinase [bacterium (Candidatus Stahlbacteria) CG23_combo_of_CG06-09_8_20_14_all_40_9]PIS25551.1 MAG: ATP-dependent 6-phosphofructokinase [bacterium (Candidatus Stahlbacteria) CG08_land_8_20_14_0_20_40_26]
MKKIGIVTRDCAGINAAIRAVVRTAYFYDIEVVGILKGYEGLINNKIVPLSRHSVSGIINQGGTILKTTRSMKFFTEEGQKEAVKTMQNNGIEGLIVIGGNGSLRGAHELATKHNIPVVGVPATIDNDINGVESAIGADTAINVALDAVDKIRDTALSLERIFVVEVMGRDCGYIALTVALAGGCEEVLLPEKEFNIKKICEEITEGNIKGKISWIIIVAEGRARASDIAKEINEITGLETREVVLGHIQRGGRATAFDRILAARYGNFAVELLKEGETDKCVTLSNNKLITIPLEDAIKPKDIEVEDYYRLIKVLT